VPSTWEGETVDVAGQRAEAAKAVLEEKVGARVFRTAVGAADPVQAIADELRAYSGYDTLVISTLPPGISRWLKLGLVHRAGRKFGLPVIHVAAEAPAPATPRWDRMFDDWAAAWSHHDVEKLVSLCTDDCVYEDVTMGAVNRGKAEMKSFANAVFAAFPDFKIQLMSGFTAGNWAGAEWTMSGTHQGDLPGIPATGKSFRRTGFHDLRADGGEDQAQLRLLGYGCVLEADRPDYWKCPADQAVRFCSPAAAQSITNNPG
jgi:steroid delta-isomerase-like uncharacterized protein